MKQNKRRLARPVYESLPWLYLLLGALALLASYLQSTRWLSLLLGLPGLAILLAGIVVMLRRRDYREMRLHYQQPDALAHPERESEDR